MNTYGLVMLIRSEDVKELLFQGSSDLMCLDRNIMVIREFLLQNTDFGG